MAWSQITRSAANRETIEVTQELAGDGAPAVPDPDGQGPLTGRDAVPDSQIDWYVLQPRAADGAAIAAIAPYAVGDSFEYNGTTLTIREVISRGYGSMTVRATA